MGNLAVEAAIKGLEAIGIDVPPSAEGFIELLINAGEDVITEVPRIISFIEQLGAEAWSTLQQVVEGMEQYGPVGYIQHQIDQGFSPHVETIKRRSLIVSNRRRKHWSYRCTGMDTCRCWCLFHCLGRHWP